MVPWLVSGIVTHFKPAATEIGFCFEGCTDGSLEAFDAIAKTSLADLGFIVHRIISAKEIGQVGGHNLLLKDFMTNSNCDVMLAPQDDQRLENSADIDLEKLLSLYGNKLGVVGGRDGFERCASHFVSNRWASATEALALLDIGQHIEKSYLNDGPIAYFRHVVDKIGVLDEDFAGFYLWEDYCQRAKLAGFINVLLGMGITHTKFGRYTKSWMGDDGNISGRDLALLRKKHGTAVR